MTEVNLTSANLVKYLTIAAKQRKRAAQKFVDDYGPQSSTVAEVNGEIAELDRAILDLASAAAEAARPSNVSPLLGPDKKPK